MSTKLLALFVIVVLSNVSAHIVKRDAPNTDTVTFSDFFARAESTLKEFEKSLLTVFNVQNTEELQQKAVEEGKKVATKLDEWATHMKEETEELKDNSAIKGLRESIDKAVDEFKSKNPETVTDIKTFIDNFNNESKGIIEKMHDLSESEDAKNIKDLSKKLLSSTTTAFQNMVEEIQKETKH